MRKTRRTSRVGETLRDALVEVFRYDLKDPRLALVSVMEVEISPDLHFARVFISGLSEEETRKIASDLNAQKGRIRHFLGQKVRLRHTPELDFRYDDTTARAGRIETLLQEIKSKDEK